MITKELKIKEEVQHSLLNHNVDFVINVPCSILNQYFLFNRQKQIKNIQVSREEEGVGLAAGLTVSGKNVVLAMQNSGYGNCINAFASLCIPYKINFITIISMRGDEHEMNPVQIPMGNATKPIITSLGLSSIEVNENKSFSAAFKEATEKLSIENRSQFILIPRIKDVKNE